MTETGRTLSEEYAEADLYGRRELPDPLWR